MASRRLIASWLSLGERLSYSPSDAKCLLPVSIAFYSNELRRLRAHLCRGSASLGKILKMHCCQCSEGPAPKAVTACLAEGQG
jgi:hypothetical protein